jgi:putative sigma-54 modulation protein
MTASDAIKVYTEEKCGERLKRYFQGKISLNWNFSMEKDERVAHCHLVGNNMNYFGEASTEDLRTSIDQALEKIEKQIKKHHDIVTSHHKSDPVPSAANST